MTTKDWSRKATVLYSNLARKGKFEIRSIFDFLRTGVTAAVLSGRRNEAQARGALMKWEIGAEMTNRQSLGAK